MVGAGVISLLYIPAQVTRLNVDPGDHKAVTAKLRSVPNLTHVLFLGRASGSSADRDLAADLEGFRSLVAAARAAGCALQMTQFMTAEDLAKGALLQLWMASHVEDHVTGRGRCRSILRCVSVG